MATVTLKGSPVETIGDLPTVGNKAPNFTLTRLDLGELRLSDCSGKVTVLNIFPSLDTPTCATAMKRFNEFAQQHKDVLFLCISADLPFAQKRFCTAEHLNNVVPVSIFRNTEFGKNYGVRITTGPLTDLLARAVVVLDKNATVIYTQLVPEIADEPDYQKVIDSINAMPA